MLTKIIHVLLPLSLMTFVQCTKDHAEFLHDNPLDPDGIYAPRVVAMRDTTVAVGSTFYLHATGTDPNGTVQQYLWALDGVSYHDSTDTHRIRVSFSKACVRNILVKVRDNDGVESAPDGVRVLVKGNAPINVSPANGAQLTGTRPTLKWIPGYYASSFTIYLDTVSPPVSVTGPNITDSSYTPPSASSLKSGRTYYWQVVGRSAGLTAPGEIWQFNTPPYPVTTTGMKRIPAKDSSFQMGSTLVTNATPVHAVTFKHDFYMDSTEVTQYDYQRLMGVNPSSYEGTVLLPVETITWFDAVLYCNKRSRHDGLDTVYGYTSVSGEPGNGCTNLGSLVMTHSKNGYRLPTEAQWEYACRAGSTTEYGWGNDTTGIGGVLWWYENAIYLPRVVATKKPNEFGLYDMTGNMWEWCNDWWNSSYSSGSQTDPTGPTSPTSGSYRVRRGGACTSTDPVHFRSAYRTYSPQYSASQDIGFRCVLPVDSTKINRYAPTLSAMEDTSVMAGDSFFVHAKGTDSNGTIVKYLWALDGITYRDSTDSGWVKTAFSNAGVKTIYVKVRNDAGLLSVADSVEVTVEDAASVTGSGQANTIAIVNGCGDPVFWCSTEGSASGAWAVNLTHNSGTL
ncbi:MAG: SUMF1/EgtB/PvdO family nonheme iron enzyme [Fibrobacterota bacterium]